MLARNLGSLAVAVVVVAAGGCAGQQGPDGTFGGYARALRSYQDKEPVARTIGRISLVPGAPLSDRTSASTAPDMADVMLHFESVADGRICFTAIEQSTAEIAYEAPEARLARVEIWLEALDELDAIKARPLRPSPGPKLDSAEVESDDHRLRETDYERVNEVVWKLCGALPAVTAQTKYLAAVVHDNTELFDRASGKPIAADDPGRDGLILWEVTAVP